MSRRYSERVPWQSDDALHGQFPTDELCEITVIGAGTLAPAVLFDTVSYGPSTGDPRASGAFSSRHDILAVGDAPCWQCIRGTGAILGPF